MKPGTHSSNSPSKLHEDENSSCKFPFNNSYDCGYALQAMRLQMFACAQNFICDHVCRAFSQTGICLMYVASIESFSTCFGYIY